MPTVIGFLWPWAINTAPHLHPPPTSLHWSQSCETLAAPHLHIYCIGLKSGEWLMWSLPPEFLAFHYYERGGGGGRSTSVYSWLKLKRTELWVFPTHFLSHAPFNQRGQVLRIFQRIIDTDKSFTRKSQSSRIRGKIFINVFQWLLFFLDSSEDSKMSLHF